MRRGLIAAAVAAGVALAGGALLAAWGGGGDDAGPSGPVPARLEARTIEAGEVTVEIEPRRLDDRGAVFGVAFDTHSVELDLDVAANATLTVDGSAWPGAAWEGDSPDGHHREGTLRFNAGGAAAGRAALTLTGLSAPVEATWTLPEG